jgi:transcriptional regulator with GAF, ATPase, and Fis domain
MISRGTEYSGDHWLWREASLSTDVASFLARTGAKLLDDLDASALHVRVIDVRNTDDDERTDRAERGERADRPDAERGNEMYVDTIAAIRRGVVGVTQPARGRYGISAAAAQRVASWIDAGLAVHSSERSGPGVTRDLLRGLDMDETGWWLIPLAANSASLGVLLIAAKASVRERRLAAVSEPIAAVLATERSRRELKQLREAAEADKEAALARLSMRDIGEAIVGSDTGLRGVMQQVEQVARTGAPVLILGETGSGKEVVARAIHERSVRAQGPILRVNCGAIPPELVDSELFGHERGSFTGAAQQRSGWFERADGGTLFLDEIGELPLAAQVRLLRVLQDGMFERVGGTRSLKVDIRLVAATHRDLGAMVRAGQFREDLWYRINVFTIRLPPLRERLDDIGPLAEHFAQIAARRFGVGALRVTPADLALLKAYAWPGNVRELSAVIERAAILGEGRRLDVERSLGVRTEPAGAAAPAGDEEFPTLDDAMRAHIQRALMRCQGRIEGPQGAARLLGLHPNTLRSKMNKLGVMWAQYRPGAAGATS